MDKLMEYICDELEEIERKAEKNGKLSMTEIQYADTLAHMKKNLLKAEEMMDGEEYSEAGGGSYRGYSRRGNSYEGGRGGQGGGSYRGGSYARGGGRGQGARRDSMGRYSNRSNYSYGSEDMVQELREMMEDAPDDRTRQELEQFIRKIDKM